MAIDIIARALAIKNSRVYIFVDNYAALLLLDPILGQLYYCTNSQGTKWLPGTLGGTYYPKGPYYFNGETFEFAETPYEATQAEVDAGIVSNTFITPKTLASSVQLYNKEPKKGSDDFYVTSAEKTKLSNTSGTNSGDNAINSLYSGLASSKQDFLVSNSNIKTINNTSILGSGDIPFIAPTWGSIEGTITNQTDLTTKLSDLEIKSIAYSIAL